VASITERRAFRAARLARVGAILRASPVALLMLAGIAGMDAQGVELLSYRPAGGEGKGFEIELFIPLEGPGAAPYPEIRPEADGVEFLQTSFSPARRGASARGLRALVLVSGDWHDAENPPSLSVRFDGGKSLFYPERDSRSAIEPSPRASGGIIGRSPPVPLATRISFDREGVAPGSIAFLEIEYSGGMGGGADPEPRAISGGAEAGEPTRAFGKGGGLILRYPFRAGLSGRLDVTVLGKLLSLPIRELPRDEDPAKAEAAKATGRGGAGIALPREASGLRRILAAMSLSAGILSAAATVFFAYRARKRKSAVIAIGFTACAAFIIAAAFLAFSAPSPRSSRDIDGNGAPRAQAGILVYPAPERSSRAFALSGAEGPGEILSTSKNDSGEEWMLVEYEDGSRGWMPRENREPVEKGAISPDR
jgi:hypothetical protein